MCGHCIIGKRVAFSAEIKVTFAHLEEHLYVPAFFRDLDDFVLIQIYVRGNKAEIFLAFVANSSFVYFCCFIDTVFLVFCEKQHAVDRKESASVRPA
mgnify:CR=1 FL=1